MIFFLMNLQNSNSSFKIRIQYTNTCLTMPFLLYGEHVFFHLCFLRQEYMLKQQRYNYLTHQVPQIQG